MDSAMDVDQDSVTQRRVLPDNTHSSSATSDVSMQVDTSFNGHQAPDLSSQGEPIAQGRILYA